MANAILERGLDRAAHDRPGQDRPGWAAPTTSGDGGGGFTSAEPTMRYGGVGSATAALLALVVAAGVFGWASVESVAPGESVALPGWLIVVLLGAFGTAILTSFKPNLARVTAPIYAVLEGLVLGAISKVYENQFDGIVVQAVGLTVLVFASMLFLYSTRILKVTDKFRRVVVGATLGLMAFYAVSMLLALFDVQAPLIWDSGPIGIGFSFLVAGLAAFNLALDFDLAERGVRDGLPQRYEWFCAFALVTSLVWLYLELLRLLSKLRD